VKDEVLTVPQINDVQGLMVFGLQELYSAEQQALAAYPQIVQAVSSPELQQALQQHMQETQTQVQRLEQLAQQMGVSAQGETECAAAQGLITDAQRLVQMIAPGPVLDAAIIGAAQKLEHLEIAGYGTARTLAQQMGQTQAAEVLEQTLSEEKATDDRLTQLAEAQVNQEAAQTSG
jgi:ferritin-like metal-binding protein YciE